MATDSHSDDLDPDAVGRREFTRSRRGFAQIEVRAFLNAVAAQLRTERQRQVELTRKLAEAESRAARGRASDAQRMTTVLGEETARIVEAAREAAQEMRERAEIETTQSRDEAAQALAEAKDAAEDTMQQASGDAQAARDQATTEAMAEVERAKDRAREMVDEARAHRERVMHDVARRRKALRSQYQTLAGVRDQMLERLDASQGLLGGAIDEVRRALNDDVQLVHSTQDSVLEHDGEHDELGEEDHADPVALDEEDHADPVALDEERVFHRVRTPAPPPSKTVDEPSTDDAAADEPEVDEAAQAGDDAAADEPEVDEEGAAGVAATAELAVDEAGEAEKAVAENIAVDQLVDDEPIVDPTDVAPSAGETEADGESEDEPEDVDLLFAKLRAESSVDEGAASPEDPDPAASATDGELDEPLDLREEDAQSQAAEEGDEPVVPDPGTEPFGARDQVLAPIDRTLQRQLKRVLADDQNGVLDRLRTVRGKPTPQRILTDLDDLVEASAEASVENLVEAYRAGATHMGGPEGDAVGAASQLHPVYESLIAEPVRASVSALLDESDDIDELSEHVRAAYRTFRTEQLADVSGHLVAAAYARGRYDGIGADVDVVWLQDPAASSPDCEDNQLAGVVTKGTVFPTGAECAPAYEGCRCLVVPAALAPTPTDA